MINQIKRNAAIEAIKYVRDHQIIGIGTGSTVNILIEELAKQNLNIQVISSSLATTKVLKLFNIEVLPFSQTTELPIYIDGADAYNNLKQAIKGKGGALTQEKILAYASKNFICIVDEHKKSSYFHKTPIPVEVIPMARSYVARLLVKLGGQPVYRSDFITDNGNVILDVYNLQLNHPIKLEETLNNIPGVVANGIFAVRPADYIIIGNQQGCQYV